jgi:nucleoside-diphosphate-sugar epimerase
MGGLNNTQRNQFKIKAKTLNLNFILTIMNVLVTGANGFIGSNLVEKLIEAGHSVRAMVLKGTNEDFIKDLDCEIVYGDITKPESLIEILKNIEVVYHLAAWPSSAWTKNVVKTNYGGTVNVFNESLNSGVKRLVYMSSTVVHGFYNFNNADENTPLVKPKWYKRPYIKSKVLCEQFLQKMQDKLDIVIIRPSHLIYGRYDTLTSKELIGRLASGKSVPNINKGKAKICYIYAENLADGLVLAGTIPEAANKTYLVGDENPQFITTKIFNDKLCEELGVKPKNPNIPYWFAAPFVGLLDLIYRLFLRKKFPIICIYTLKVAKYNLDFKSDKVRSELGFKSKISLDEGIKRTVSWYKSYFNKNNE